MEWSLNVCDEDCKLEQQSFDNSALKWRTAHMQLDTDVIPGFYLTTFQVQLESKNWTFSNIALISIAENAQEILLQLSIINSNKAIFSIKSFWNYCLSAGQIYFSAAAWRWPSPLRLHRYSDKSAYTDKESTYYSFMHVYQFIFLAIVPVIRKPRIKTCEIWLNIQKELVTMWRIL